MDAIFTGTLIASMLRVATPLILCAMAGVLAERSGVIDLGLEGKMLFAAFAAAATGVITGSLPMAIAMACVMAILLSWVHGYACVTHRGDQVVSGMAINIIAAGLTVVVSIAWFKEGGQTPPAPAALRIEPMVFVAVTMAIVAFVWWLLAHTRFGLRLRAVGENPHMVDAA